MSMGLRNRLNHPSAIIDYLTQALESVLTDTVALKYKVDLIITPSYPKMY